MSREVKRVPLDFDAPIGVTWAPLLRPAETRLPACPECNGSGYTATAKWFEAITHLYLMMAEDVAAQARGREMHPYLAELGNAPYEIQDRTVVTRRPGADAVDLAVRLVGEEPDPIWGFGGSATSRACRKISAALGLPETWGYCPICDGEGSNPTPEQQAAYDAWSPAEIPTGEGWQLWETISDGGPVSLVFDNAEALAVWLSTPSAGRERMSSLDAARRFVAAGWAPSGADQGGSGYQTGTEWVASLAEDRAR
jgi:hypothetical protein